MAVAYPAEEVHADDAKDEEEEGGEAGDVAKRRHRLQDRAD